MRSRSACRTKACPPPGTGTVALFAHNAVLGVLLPASLATVASTMDISRATMGSMRYLTPSPVHRALGLFSLGAGRQHGAVPWVLPRYISCYCAVLVRSGSGAFHGRATYPVVGPALVWLFPGVAHSYGPDENGWDEEWLLFDGAATGPYRDLGLLDPARPVQRLTDPDPMVRLVTEAVDLVLDDDPRRLTEVTGLIHQLVSRFSPGPKQSAADEVARYLRVHAFDPTSVAVHADRLGLTDYHLRRIVREHTGMSPKEYLVNHRLERAKLLLAQTDRTVVAIAREVGYDDPGYFTRIFTRHAGVSPSAFRDHH